MNPGSATGPRPDLTTGPTTALSIGLTGGIGSGKSTVAAELVALGAQLVDTDAIAHALTQRGGAAMDAIAAAFGAGVVAPDGSLDRERMRGLVFADAAAKARLEALLHPMIGAEAQRRAAAAGAGRVVVFDVPLLAESRHWRERVDRVLVVDCSVPTQIARVARRPGWSADAAARVIARQATREQRRAIADAVIHNDGITPAALAAQVRSLWSRWTAAPG